MGRRRSRRCSARIRGGLLLQLAERAEGRVTPTHSAFSETPCLLLAPSFVLL